METSLHQQLKELYARDVSQREVWVDGYRIDGLVGGQLIEIQQASLAALKEKLRELLLRHSVTVVKPLALHKTIIKRARKNSTATTKRASPVHQGVLHVFEDLVHFLTVFPHPRLTLEVLLTHQEEHRVPARKRRWRSKDYRVTDRRLVAVAGRHVLRTADDLRDLLPPELSPQFTTADLAAAATIPRWLAQKIAYCLRCTGAAQMIGKQGNSALYELPALTPAPATVPASPNKVERKRKPRAA